ncbi:MAG: hypothetical protein DIAAKJNI_00474 [Candidatus Argoarchaeum ethanivorans]|uniref:Uncharacterized protein n=1 Tax=Candidatus Argoarchaeum ethanivorans TaxID=2608793 RepID=A0A811T7S5_9EURY|nr:MAG: hypothetical protein DIAAKJNI_00474 [Candidatus Argoarchaeum ethanivorans]
MTLKPWYKVVTPREDLREGKPLDASEFAVHLDHIRRGMAPEYYQHPERFFERTYLTKGLESLSAEVIRRLSGIRVETSAVFNMATQFGGGKTHALALLYHLARGGPEAASWAGVNNILKRAGVNDVPQTATAVFVGTEFDSIRGRGGKDGEPLRKTPWGEIAWQLGGLESFKIVEEHDKQSIAPGNDVIREFLPKDRPCLILMDELMNYVSRFRKMGMVTQFYDFLQNLSEEALGQDRVVLVVSIPASEIEMTTEDHSDYKRFEKMLDRVGKAIMMSAEDETSEIIRRRLFEWTGVPDDSSETIEAYADWVVDHRNQVGDFPVDHAREAFRASYPFHPTVLSVFERKWRGLPHFQQTRGILRLLALWVSKAYQDGFKGAHSDLLITLGSAPLGDLTFRAAIFEQLGERQLETAVTTDICGKPDAHSIRLDYEAAESIKKTRLHQKVATTIFFESNGGQLNAEATVPEIRLAVAEPEMDIGNIETVLETLGESCYYLNVGRSRYRFTRRVQLNKMLADRLSVIQDPKIEELVRAEIQNVFPKGEIEKVFFPEKSGQIPDRAALTMVVLPPELSLTDEKRTSEFIESFTREYGTSARTFKSALIWTVPDSSDKLNEEARKLLAWKDINDEKEELHLDDTQKRRLGENLKKSSRDLKETVWRTYKHVMFLGKDNQIQHIDLGRINSSAGTLVSLVLNRLRQEDIVKDNISPNFLVRKWPPAFKEWSTKSVRDVFFASPQFPRLLDAESIKDTIVLGVSDKIIAYGGKSRDGGYEPFYYGEDVPVNEIELSDDMFIITGEEAEKHIEPPELTTLDISPLKRHVEPGNETRFTVKGFDQHNHEIALEDVEWVAAGGTIDATGVFLAGQDEGRFVVTAKIGEIESSAEAIISKLPPPPLTQPEGATKLSWSGEVPSQKWMNFYTKVLSRFASGKGLKLVLSVEAAPEGGVSDQKIEDVKIALRELGLDDDVSTE